MKTVTIRQRFTLAVIGAATIIGASACGSTGTGAGSSAVPSTVPGSADASMEPGMTMSASPTASSMGASGGSTGATAQATIHIKSFAYTGAESVPAGSTVTVMNMDNEAHTVTADDGSFDAVVKAGTSTTFTAPAKPGTYTYHCTYHSNMHGTLSVK
ncbi:cupredoxin domain-containing protein [Pseudarthrobacter sp. NPDC080039]|uniref:cupredoxin domain-containing protein n=1 Tax=unclassified Pseudarthrobacter TaxID=2647000 RepID=UPI00344C18FB